jgi:hypothetical protein
VLGFCNVGALLLATSISGVVFRQTQSFTMVAALAGGFALVSILILLRIPEPRRARKVREPSLASATGS